MNDIETEYRDMRNNALKKSAFEIFLSLLKGRPDAFPPVKDGWIKESFYLAREFEKVAKVEIDNSE